MFRSLGSGSNGVAALPSASPSFGLPNARWGEVETFTQDLPWSFPWGNITKEDVDNAQGDGSALGQLLENWRNYTTTQTKNLETWEEVRKQQLELAKAVMASRANAAALDSKLNQSLYGHETRMGVLGHRDANNADLAKLQLELGINLEDHKHRNNQAFARSELHEQISLESTKARFKKQSLVERYRAARGQVTDPQAKEPTYTPTTGRVLRFGRRAA